MSPWSVVRGTQHEEQEMKYFRCRLMDFLAATNILYLETIRVLNFTSKGTGISLRERLLKIRNIDLKTKAHVRHLYMGVDVDDNFGSVMLQTPYGLGQYPVNVAESLLVFLRFGDPKNDWHHLLDKNRILIHGIRP